MNDTVRKLIDLTYGERKATDAFAVQEISKIKHENPTAYAEFKKKEDVVEWFVAARRRNGEHVNVTPENYNQTYELAVKMYCLMH